jgi:translation initiation factor 1 (eIF-1/SUI1)
VFKTRAGKVEKALTALGHTVRINPDKPRKGSFVITIEDHEQPIVELLSMARPFKALREMDMDEVVKDVLAVLDA